MPWRIIRHIQLAAVAIEEGEEKIQRLVVPGHEANEANLPGVFPHFFGKIQCEISRISHQIRRKVIMNQQSNGYKGGHTMPDGIGGRYCYWKKQHELIKIKVD